MRKTKASFKAVRERCGLSQADVADELGVSVSAVKKWENPSYQHEPPDDVFAWLVEMKDLLQSDAAILAGKAESMLRESGCGGPVAIRYYRTQEQLDAVQLPDRDMAVGYANAISREAARLLAEEGIDVEFHYPEHMVMVDEAKDI